MKLKIVALVAFTLLTSCANSNFQAGNEYSGGGSARSENTPSIDNDSLGGKKPDPICNGNVSVSSS